MKKRMACMLALLMIGLVAIGCGGDKQEPQPSAGPSPTQGDVARDPLNGSTEVHEYKPVISTIDNAEAARPQEGIQAADIVYEMQVEGGMTRLMIVLNSEIPEQIGPVRSLRQYYAQVAQEYDAVVSHVGGPHNGDVLDIYKYLEKNPIKVRVDGLYDSKRIYRVSERKKPHNAMLDTKAALEKYDYTPTVRSFLFDPAYVPTDGDAAQVTIEFAANGYDVTYTYDAATGLYTRSQGGKEHKDALTKKAVTVKNIIVQKAKYTNYPGGQLADVIGSGEVTVISNGKKTVGTWSKKSATEPTVFKDANGNEIPLQPGNTWIHIQPDNLSLTCE